jgi:hypothetical protein
MSAPNPNQIDDPYLNLTEDQLVQAARDMEKRLDTYVAERDSLKTVDVDQTLQEMERGELFNYCADLDDADFSQWKNLQKRAAETKSIPHKILHLEIKIEWAKKQITLFEDLAAEKRRVAAEQEARQEAAREARRQRERKAREAKKRAQREKVWAQLRADEMEAHRQVQAAQETWGKSDQEWRVAQQAAEEAVRAAKEAKGRVRVAKRKVDAGYASLITILAKKRKFEREEEEETEAAAGNGEAEKSSSRTHQEEQESQMTTTFFRDQVMIVE